MKKKLLSFLLAVAMMCSMVPTAFAASAEAIDAANALHEQGLFNGVGTNADGTPNFDLDRTPTRHEAVTMLVAMLGKSSEAQAGNWTTPFTDVADWAKPFVGYAYTNGLTSGTSATTYGGNQPVSATQYLTFVLTALGYKSGTDFQWDKAWELSDKLGITNGQYNATSLFTRGDVAIISYKSLSAPQKVICSHEFTEKITPATCTMNGNRIRTCDICGQSFNEIIYTQGHKFDNGKIVSEATFSSAGNKVYTCEDCGMTKSETIPKLDMSSLTKYRENKYMVGTNIPTGRYILISDVRDGYFSITSDPNGSNTLANDNFGHVTYVDLYPYTYLELSDCYAVPYMRELTFNPVNNGYVTGTYEVGKDIAPGTYKLTAISGGYYEITDSPQGNTLDNDYFGKGTSYISLEKGEFIQFDSVYVESM